MIYLFGGLIFWLFLLLTSKRKLFSAEERRKRRLQLIEYAGAAAIFTIMLEAILRSGEQTPWYPWLVIAIITGYYLRKLLIQRRSRSGDE